jgi:hypothetical protein
MNSAPPCTATRRCNARAWPRPTEASSLSGPGLERSASSRHRRADPRARHRPSAVIGRRSNPIRSSREP